MNGEHILRSQTRALAQAWTVVGPAVFQQRQPADRALAAHIQAHPELGGRDRRLIGDCVHGLFRWWGWIGHLAPPPDAPPAAETWAPLWLAVAVAQQDPPAPIHAYWAAQAALPPEVLAVLAAEASAPLRVAALLAALARPAPAAPAPEQLLPAWCAAEIRCPQPLPALIEWLQRRPPLWLRLQADEAGGVLQALRDAGFDPRPEARLPAAVSLGAARVNLQTLAPYRDGRVEVQDLASQAVGAACGARPDEHWWDACAGAGGKTLMLARAAGPRGRVLATDARAEALAALRRRAERAGLSTVSARVWTGASAPRERFDGVLVDAPCSGSGTWRRSPWARWQLSQEDVRRHAQRQGQLLAQAAGALKPGGLLVYATCSLFAAENEAVVAAFRAAHPRFTPELPAHPLTGAPCAGAATIWPWEGDCDAMFVARLRLSQR